MGIDKVKVELFCINCDKETLHEIVYISNKLAKTKCLNCGLTLKFDEQELILIYTEDFVKRILTKPSRMLKEAYADLSSFLKSLPIRIITKPKRVIDEIKEIADD
ncbi:MAG: bh protein [Nitrososphaeria archaeon]